MGLLVVGSVAIDSIETPFGKREKSLGGSAAYFSTSASFFHPARMVGVIGEDYPQEAIDFFKEIDIDTEGLMREKGKTFFWHGKYDDVNEAITIKTELNVFEHFDPVIPDSYKDSKYVFCANIDPELQLKVIKEIKFPRLIALDTMNFWITSKRDALLETIKHIDILFVNSTEAKMLTGQTNLYNSVKEIMRMGPRAVVVKQGEFGAMFANGLSFFSAPAYPIRTVFDPTGAGDSFAGGMMGYLAETDDLSDGNLRKSILMGTVNASYCVEAFSFDRFKELELEEVYSRFDELLSMNSVSTF